MNIPQIGEHSYSPRKFARFNNANVNTQQGGNSHSRAAFLNISQEAKEKAAVASVAVQESEKNYEGVLRLIRDWKHEVFAEALKNGSSIETAIKDYGMEIAEYYAAAGRADGNYVTADDVEDFFNSITSFIDGGSYGDDSFKEAFSKHDETGGMSKALDDWNHPFYASFFEMESALRESKEGWKKYNKWKAEGSDPSKAPGGFLMGVYSYRHGGDVYPPESGKSFEERALPAPEEEKSKDEAPKDKSDIFKGFVNFAKRMRASFKNGVESNLRHTANRENSILNEYVKISKAVKKKGSGISKEHIKTGKGQKSSF